MTRDDDLRIEFLKSLFSGLAGGMLVFLAVQCGIFMSESNYNIVLMILHFSIVLVLSLVVMFIFWLLYKWADRKKRV